MCNILFDETNVNLIGAAIDCTLYASRGEVIS